jgi:hypothetical protein
VIALAPLTVAADSHSDVEALKRGLRVFPSGVVALCTNLDDGNQHAVHQTDHAAGMAAGASYP